MSVQESANYHFDRATRDFSSRNKQMHKVPWQSNQPTMSHEGGQVSGRRKVNS